MDPESVMLSELSQTGHTVISVMCRIYKEKHTDTHELMDTEQTGGRQGWGRAGEMGEGSEGANFPS